MPRKNALNFDAIRSRVRKAKGKVYWRSLAELADTPEFRKYLDHEFPEQASRWGDGPSRREFLKLMAASFALAGLSGCTATGGPEEKIVPYVRMPEYIVPGKPLYFATAMAFGGYGSGLLVESHMGRPTKIEGNPDHPASLGSTDLFAQASLLQLYDPDRSQVVVNAGKISTRKPLVESLEARLIGLRARKGKGLRILNETFTSPTLTRQAEKLLDAFPEAKWHQWEPVFGDAEPQAARLAFGDDVGGIEPRYHFDRADVVLSLDADFLAGGHYPVRYARDFMQRRGPNGEAATAEMTRVYSVESTPSLVGSKADHRRALPPAQIAAVALAVARRLGVDVETPQGLTEPKVPSWWLDALADDLENYRLQGDSGAALVVAGRHQPPVVHALAHAINERLGAVGTSVSYLEPLTPELGGGRQGRLESLTTLVEDMRSGEVETLIILGGNPVFNAPADLGFAEALAEVPYRLRLSLYYDETSRFCQWHVPQKHFLETWSDVRAFDGTASVIQPLIGTMYAGWSEQELLSRLLGESESSDYDLVRDTWRDRAGDADFEEYWYKLLHAGIVPETSAETREISLRDDFSTAIAEAARDEFDGTDKAARSSGDGDRFTVVFRPDPTVWDGRYANNGWMQELPKPLTSLTWDTAAMISPGAAERLGLSNEDMVELSRGERTLRVPVWILPGQPDECITLHFGYGRTAAGRVGDSVGFDAYPFRTSDAPWFATGVRLTKLGGSYPLATTQHHHLMNPEHLAERHLVREGTLGELRRHPEHPPFVHPHHQPAEKKDEEHAGSEGDEEKKGERAAKEGAENGKHPSLYPEWEYPGYKWGMVVDQTACTGCSACVVACQAENNIPVVGKEEVRRGREMHWLRIDSYYKGDLKEPETFHQPVPCMHCEKAPCEVVCPVAATTHSDEGINEMTYNRCVGTRYCSNNCPYKVRRFNFLHYTSPVEEEPVLQLLQNPDVTVRSSGVMEKCTYCIQRISAARIEAEKESRTIRAGEVQTACQQVCPTQAITFGDLNNHESEAYRLRHEPLNYALLGELGTQPRTTHLAVVRNPNPKIQEHQRDGEGA